MKTKFLLFLSLALGATISCMEQQLDLEQLSSWQSLPVELRQHILSYVANAKNVTELINNLKDVMATNKELYGISQAIIHEFAKKYIEEHKDEALEEFFEALTSKKKSVVNAFIDAGLDFKDQYAVGSLRAAIGGSLDMVRTLLKRGVDVNAQDKDGMTALDTAALKGDPELVKLLLENGAHAKAKNQSGSTPLMTASAGGNPEVIRLLIKAGADVNAQDAAGRTALWLAVFYGKDAVVRALLEHGADANIADSLGKRPSDVANEWGRTDIVEILEQGKSW